MMRTMAQKLWVWKETEQAKCPGHYSYVPGCSNPRDHLHLAQSSFKEIDLRLQILLVTPREHNWDDLCMSSKSNKHEFSIAIIIKSGEVRFSI